MALLKWTSIVAQSIVFILAVIGIIAKYLSKSIKALTTVRGFMTIGVAFAVTIFFLAFTSTISLYQGKSDLFSSFVLPLIIMSLLLMFIWGIYSTLANAKVATLSNAILAGCLGILLEIKNVVFGFLPNRIGILPLEMQVVGEQIGYSEAQIFTAIISAISLPIFLALTFTTIMCAIKMYWIKKYNKGHDINSELDVNWVSE